MVLAIVELPMLDQLATASLAAAVLITGIIYLSPVDKAERARRHALTKTKRDEEDYENSVW